MKDFFILYHNSDSEKVECIVSKLESEDYLIKSRSIDNLRGRRFSDIIDESLNLYNRVILVLSPNFLNVHFTLEDWNEIFDSRRSYSKRIIPIQIADCFIDILLPNINFIDLSRLGEKDVGGKLLEEVKRFLLRNPLDSISMLHRERNELVGLPSIWNVPIYRNSDFLGRESILIKMRNCFTMKDKSKSLIVLHGLGGVGKTSISVEYAYRYTNYYSIVWWIRGSNVITMMNDLLELSRYLKLSSDINDEPEETIVRLFSFLKDQKRCLLIYDNANDFQELLDFLPKDFNGHIILTSRNSDWELDTETVNVPILSRDESIELLRRKTGCFEDISSNDLSELLSDLPLALVQVSSYIKNENITILEYLKLLELQGGNFSKHIRTEPSYPTTLITSFNLSFEKIASGSELARKLLNYCSFLASEKIGVGFLKNLLYNNWYKDEELSNYSKKFDNAVNILEDYSLIKVDEDYLSIHKLVQRIIQDSMDVTNRELLRDKLLFDINNAFYFDHEDLQSWHICQDLLPHTIHICEIILEEESQKETLGDLFYKIGNFLLHSCNFLESRIFLKRAIKIYIFNYGRLDVKVADVIHSMGLIYKELGKYEISKRFFEFSLSIDENIENSKSWRRARDLNSIGSILLSMDNLEDALLNYESALKLNEELYGSDHVEVARNLNNIGLVLKYMNRYESSLNYLEKALSIDINNQGSIHPNVSDVYLNIASVYRRLGEFEKSKDLFNKALQIDIAIFGESHSKVANKSIGLGQLLLEVGDNVGALTLFKKALSIHRKLYGDDHFYIAFDFTYLGDHAFKEGDIMMAGVYYKQALEMVKKYFDDEHPNIKTLNRRIAKVEQLAH